MENAETLEANNDQILFTWIAKCLGIEYSFLMKETFLIDTDTCYNEILIKFAPSTSTLFLKKCNGFDGNYAFTISNHNPKFELT